MWRGINVVSQEIRHRTPRIIPLQASLMRKGRILQKTLTDPTRSTANLVPPKNKRQEGRHPVDRSEASPQQTQADRLPLPDDFINDRFHLKRRDCGLTR